MNRTVHKIDATNQTLGRLASRVAILLRGKQKVNFQPHIDNGDFVYIKNAQKMRFTGSKLEKKKYFHFSGYLGGMKEITLKKQLDKEPGFILKHAVKCMLPNNKLRAVAIKRLKFIKGE